MFDNEALKTLLDNRNIKQAAFARMADIPRNSLCRYLSGAVQPKSDKVKAIADALGVSMEFLMKEPPQPPKLKLCFCPNCGVNLEGVVK